MRLRWSALLVAASLVIVTPVLAQTAAENERALALGHEGLGFYNKGSWADAQQRFAEADRLAHSPVFILYLARSARNAGDLAAAKEAYDRLAREVVPAGAPAPWVGAVESGKQEGAELDKRLAAAPPPAASTAAPALSVPVPTATVSVPVTGPRALPTAMPPEETAGERLRPYTPALAVLGVGVVGLGAGAGLFVHAKSMADDVLSRCDQSTNVCLASDAPKKQSAVDMASGAAVAAAIGAAAMATGLILVVVLDPGKKPASRGALKIEPGLGALRISGSF